MIFDAIVVIFTIGALITGFRNGLVTTILRGAFFIVGGIAGMYFVIQKNQSGWLIIAILVGAYLGALLGALIAKTLKVSLIRGPLRLIDSLLGSALEVTKYLLFFFIIGTILLWAPWPTGQNQIAESKVYLQLNKHAPKIVSELRRQVEQAIKTNLRP